MVVTEKVELQGRFLSFETGKVAKQADGACLVRFGDTTVLATLCFQSKPREGVDFLPLTVDYRENTYAGGRIPGGWFKREGRPTEKEILTCRLIDRPFRPLFPDGYTHETQIIAMVLSADSDNDPDILAINAASTALALSNCPFQEVVGAVRVSRVDGALVVNPTHTQREVADLEIVVAGTKDAIVMVEAGAKQVPESVILDALDVAHAAIRDIVAAQIRLREVAGKAKLSWTPPPTPWPSEFAETIRNQWAAPLGEALRVRGKMAQKQAIDGVEQRALAAIPADEAPVQAPWVKAILRELIAELFREAVLHDKERLDGRAFNTIRQVTCEVGLLARTHGSALFTRGETQALVTCTLGTSDDVQIVEAFEGESHQRFLLHYNFPPFSVGEVKFLRGPGRREIGHGALARRALSSLLPDKETFPYTLRVVSDILESNGSSSMATVCGATLAMMDAGVPLATPIAGIAMGLVSDGARFGVLTDIAGQEDHYGDMDFKVAGSRTGITALQMDIKVSGLSREILEQALEQARQARIELLDTMSAALDQPRPDISVFAPRIITIRVDTERIRDIIGPGGKTIRAICEQTGAKINIEDDGLVEIATPDGEAAERAIQIIQGLTRQPQIGEVFDGVVKRIEPYGAFVEILPNHDGLLHISELAYERTREVTDVLKLGDTIQVKIIGIDGNDRIKLSRKALLPKPDGFVEEEPRRPPRRDEGGHRGPRSGDRGDRRPRSR